MRKYCISMLLAILLGFPPVFSHSGEIIRLTVPKKNTDKGEGGWKLSAKESVSDLKISWEDSGGKKYSSAFSFHEYPNGMVGGVVKINPDDTSTAVYCPPRQVPLADIQKILSSKKGGDLILGSPNSYEGTYSLIDGEGKVTQILEVKPVGKNGEQLVFTSGTIHFVLPKGEDPADQVQIKMLVDAPGTRLILRPGVISGAKKLVDGTIFMDLLLKDVEVKDRSGKKRVIKNVLFRRVSFDPAVQPRIVEAPGGK